MTLAYASPRGVRAMGDLRLTGGSFDTIGFLLTEESRAEAARPEGTLALWFDRSRVHESFWLQSWYRPELSGWAFWLDTGEEFDYSLPEGQRVLIQPLPQYLVPPTPAPAYELSVERASLVTDEIVIVALGIPNHETQASQYDVRLNPPAGLSRLRE